MIPVVDKMKIKEVFSKMKEKHFIDTQKAR